MANESKQLSDAEAQAQANVQAAEVYKQAIGKKFTDVKKVGEVREYVPSRLTGTQARQCFLVNYGHPNISFFMPCKEFLEQFKPVTDEVEVPQPQTALPH